MRHVPVLCKRFECRDLIITYQSGEVEANLISLALCLVTYVFNNHGNLGKRPASKRDTRKTNSDWRPSRHSRRLGNR